MGNSHQIHQIRSPKIVDSWKDYTVDTLHTHAENVVTTTMVVYKVCARLIAFVLELSPAGTSFCWQFQQDARCNTQRVSVPTTSEV